MGILTSIGKMFSASEPQRVSRPSTNGHPVSADELDADAGGVAVLDQASALRERMSVEDETPEPAPIAIVEETKPAPPRNKQELFDELQRNYRDVVDLVKKVDTHLDRNEQRAQEMLSIAKRIDKAMPSIERYPEVVREEIEALKSEVVSAIESSSDKGEARGAQLQQTLATIGERIDTTSSSHTQLVTTMAGFRETLGELATNSSRTSEVLESIDTRRQEREDELTKMLIASRRWSVTTLAVTLLGVSGAMAIAIIALLMQG